MEMVLEGCWLAVAIPSILVVQLPSGLTTTAALLCTEDTTASESQSEGDNDTFSSEERLRPAGGEIGVSRGDRPRNLSIMYSVLVLLLFFLNTIHSPRSVRDIIHPHCPVPELKHQLKLRLSSNSKPVQSRHDSSCSVSTTAIPPRVSPYLPISQHRGEGTPHAQPVSADRGALSYHSLSRRHWEQISNLNENFPRARGGTQDA